MWKLLDVKEIEIWYSSKLTLFFSILYLMQVNGSITNEDEDEEKMKVRKKLVHFLMWNFHVHWLILHSYYILYFISAKPEFPKDSSKYIWDCKILGKSDPRKQRSYWSVFNHFFASRWNSQLNVKEKTWELFVKSTNPWVKMQRIGK